MTHEDKAWLAGLVEGEGSFTYQLQPSGGARLPYPIFGMRMTDLDVMERASSLIGGKLYGPYVRKPHKTFWDCRIYGPKAVRFALDMFAHMGQRRREQIANLLELDMQRKEGVRY